MYYYKLIILIFLFLLIFINISFGRKCKCPKDERDYRRYKRGAACSCFGGGERGGYNSDKERKRKGKQIVEEEEEEHQGMVGNIFTEDISKKNALYICDNFAYSHLQFNTSLANILSANYNVDMLVYSKEDGLKVEDSNKFRIIYVPINDDRLNQHYLREYGKETAYVEYKNSDEYFMIGVYAEIITNEQVIINGINVGIYDWLKKTKYYSFGIAEFNLMAGSFLVFNELGIENTFDVSPSVFIPSYFQFLGIDITKFQVPTLIGPVPGEWKFEQNYQKKVWKYMTIIKYQKLHEETNTFRMNLMNSIYFINKFLNDNNIHNHNLPSLINLFKNIKYHFINQHKLTNFYPYPTNKKIIYIGGLHVEEKGILTKRKKIETQHYNCIIFVSFGSNKITGDLENDDIEIMLNIFKKYSNCHFKVRIGNHELIKKFKVRNIEFLKGFVNQQKILAEENLKLFISQCGMNSFIEAIYAGVPLICIPSSKSDQYYISSLVEYLGIGIYVNHFLLDDDDNIISDFGNDLHNAISEIIEPNSIYQNAAKQLREYILYDFENSPSIKVDFLGEIIKVIGV